MCGLAGISIYGKNVKVNVPKLAKALAIGASSRGTHATGFAYVTDEGLCINKKAAAATKYGYRFLPKTARQVMIHTRHTTQGSEKLNYNNHPFVGNYGKVFALAHNGVLNNDYELKQEETLPETVIQTDSYVMVQLIEKYGNLKDAAERVEGMFTFSILEEDGTLHFVKNDSPLTIYQFDGFYVYASTTEILEAALFACGIDSTDAKVIEPIEGQILTLHTDGSTHTHTFKVKEYVTSWKHYLSQGYSDDGYLLDWALQDGYTEAEFYMVEKNYSNWRMKWALEDGEFHKLVIEAYRDLHYVGLEAVK